MRMSHWNPYFILGHNKMILPMHMHTTHKSTHLIIKKVTSCRTSINSQVRLDASLESRQLWHDVKLQL